MNLLRRVYPFALIFTCYALGLSTVSFAQKSRFVPEHDFRLGIGAYPGFADAFELDRDYDYWARTSPSEMYDDRLTYMGEERVTGSITASYSFRFTKLLSLGASFSYAGQSRNHYNLSDDTKAASTRLDRFMLTPMVRLSWMNRSNVRLYSQAGLGLGYVLQHDDRLPSSSLSRSTAFVSMQMTFIGLSVGRKFFGFTELGCGTQGVLIAGIGYRFNSKNK